MTEQSTNNDTSLVKRPYFMEELNKPIPLKYIVSENYSSYKNILFIDSQVTNYNKFYTNCNIVLIPKVPN